MVSFMVRKEEEMRKVAMRIKKISLRRRQGKVQAGKNKFLSFYKQDYFIGEANPQLFSKLMEKLHHHMRTKSICLL
ncbi:hypothetical protein Sjap_002615 [Stephania japonica]|uniref:Uncharacterized protein n=1 Tax=Stephania japonica TaxID=461633 RepID=A0AAP0KN43_9MAGN